MADSLPPLFSSPQAASAAAASCPPPAAPWPSRRPSTYLHCPSPCRGRPTAVPDPRAEAGPSIRPTTTRLHLTITTTPILTPQTPPSRRSTTTTTISTPCPTGRPLPPPTCNTRPPCRRGAPLAARCPAPPQTPRPCRGRRRGRRDRLRQVRKRVPWCGAVQQAHASVQMLGKPLHCVAKPRRPVHYLVVSRTIAPWAMAVASSTLCSCSSGSWSLV